MKKKNMELIGSIIEEYLSVIEEIYKQQLKNSSV
jgi:hypothetical protein